MVQVLQTVHLDASDGGGIFEHGPYCPTGTDGAGQRRGVVTLVALCAGVKFLSDVVLRTGCVETRGDQVHNGVFVSATRMPEEAGGLDEQKLLSRPPVSARTNTTRQRQVRYIDQ